MIYPICVDMSWERRICGGHELDVTDHEVTHSSAEHPCTVLGPSADPGVQTKAFFHRRYLLFLEYHLGMLCDIQKLVHIYVYFC